MLACAEAFLKPQKTSVRPKSSAPDNSRGNPPALRSKPPETHDGARLLQAVYRLGSNCFGLLPSQHGLNLDLLRSAAFRHRYLNIEHAVAQNAFCLVRIYSTRQGYGTVELAIGKLEESVLLVTRWDFPFPFNHELIILHRHSNIFLLDTREHGANIQTVIIPARFQRRAERPEPVAVVGLSTLTVNVFKHLIDRTAEMVQRLPHIISEQCVQHGCLPKFFKINQRRTSNYGTKQLVAVSGSLREHPG